jgi:hypothetical protein
MLSALVVESAGSHYPKSFEPSHEDRDTSQELKFDNFSISIPFFFIYHFIDQVNHLS